MKFENTSPVRILFGSGLVREAAPLTKSFGPRALVVTGRDPRRAEPLLASLKQGGVEPLVASFAGEPEISQVASVVEQFRLARIDCVIGFGGGSALDAAKAVAAMLANDGDLLDYVEIIGRGRVLTKPSVPFIAIPTTAGTGSEVTRNAVLSSPEHQLKVSLRSPLMLARVAIVDPELTLGLPAAITASTGLDALTQLIEPYVCTRATPVTDAWCVTGLRAARSLMTAYTDGKNLAAREDMALASVCGGLALANAGLGAVHGLAAPLGGMFGAAHGEICATLLPHVMWANICALRERAPDSPALRRYDEVARMLAPFTDINADQDVGWIRQWVHDLKIPSLSQLGVKAESFNEVAARALQSSSMKANPITLTPAELVGILNAAA